MMRIRVIFDAKQLCSRSSCKNWFGGVSQDRFLLLVLGRPTFDCLPGHTHRSPQRQDNKQQQRLPQLQKHSGFFIRGRVNRAAWVRGGFDVLCEAAMCFRQQKPRHYEAAQSKYVYDDNSTQLCLCHHFNTNLAANAHSITGQKNMVYRYLPIWSAPGQTMLPYDNTNDHESNEP
jgi:hypothetical protein